MSYRPLLRILQSEEDEYKKLVRIQDEIRMFTTELERIKSYPYDCQTKIDDIEQYKGFIDRALIREKSQFEILNNIRREIDDYFRCLSNQVSDS